LLSTFRKIVGTRSRKPLQNSNTDDALSLSLSLSLYLSLIDEAPCLAGDARRGLLADTRLFYEIGGASDEFIALILDTMLARLPRETLCPSSHARMVLYPARGGGGEASTARIVAAGRVYRETFNICTHQDANEALTIMNAAREDASEGFRPLPRSLFK